MSSSATDSWRHRTTFSRTNDSNTRCHKSRVFRLSLIPTEVEEPQLRQYLEQLGQHRTNEITPSNETKNVMMLSLTPRDTWKVGIVTFHQEPAELRACSPSRHLKLPLRIPEKEDTEIAIDVDFYGMTLLYCPDNNQHTVDIFAIPGLSSHAFGSWRSSTGPTMWLRDCLPEDLPGVRIFTYGYDSALQSSTSTSSLMDFARQLLNAVHRARAGDSSKPILFIAHSMGGLIVKQALTIAALGTSGNDRAILRSCVGFFLFGVPNRGLNTKNLETLVRGQKNETLIRDLREGSPLLRMVHDSFQQVFTYKDCSFVSFYETKDSRTIEVKNREWKKTGRLVRLVDRISATSFCPVEELHDQVPIDTDHLNLVKFDGRHDLNYDTVCSKLKEVVERASETIKKRGDSTQSE